jgi:hypothetical protein
MEAFAESIAKLEGIEMRRDVTTVYVGAQGTHKAFTDYLKSINLNKGQKDQGEIVDEFLSAFKTGFKGID